MAPPKGNKFWEARSSHGRNPIFENSQDLERSCLEYFQWVEDNPLEKAIVYQGAVSDQSEHIMRAMTVTGLCLFLDISHDTWLNYRKKDGFIGVCTRMEAIIYSQKFAGAAGGLLNASIIARDLGLKDKQEVEATVHVSETLADRLTDNGSKR